MLGLGSILHELNLIEFFFHLEAQTLIFGDGKLIAKWHFPNISAGLMFGKIPEPRSTRLIEYSNDIAASSFV